MAMARGRTMSPFCTPLRPQTRSGGGRSLQQPVNNPRPGVNSNARTSEERKKKGRRWCFIQGPPAQVSLSTARERLRQHVESGYHVGQADARGEEQSER